jgi:alkaline phosphatase
MKRFIFVICLVCTTLFASAEVKYVFYFIGDGMGANQVLGAEMYRSALQGEPLGRVQTLMTTFPYSGSASSYSKSNGITDSAAAGTCLATGSKTNNGMLGLDQDSAYLTTIAEELKEQGWGIGIMTTVAIDHATPAAFYAHVPKRNSYYKIGEQLCASGFDFFGGAGFHHPQGKKDDKRINLYRLAERSGYTIAHGMEEVQELLNNDFPQSTLPGPAVDRLILVQKDDDQGARHGSNLPYAVDRQEGDLSLAQIVSTAIPFLDSRFERFFMMVEGGMVDYACHGDDAVTAFGEVWDMDEAMRVAYEFYLAHPDETLIVVTADHETGGLALGNSDYTLHLDLLQNQKCSAWKLSDLFSELFENDRKASWEQVKSIFREQLGFWDSVEITEDEEHELKDLYKAVHKGHAKDTETMYKNINTLSDAGIGLLNKKAHVGWTTHAHSAHVVPVFAIGAGAEHFSGWHDNTEIVPLIREAVSVALPE